MGVQTILICSKFSANCTKLLDSLIKLNINLHPLIRLVWIDHPNIRSVIMDSNKIKTVPAIIVHDEERDVSVVYEGQKFTDYMNTFIHNHQTSSVKHPSGLMAATNNAMASHQAARETIQQATFDMAYHQANNPYLQEKNHPAIQTAMRNNITQSMYGSTNPEDRKIKGDVFLANIQKSIQHQEAEAQSIKEDKRLQREQNLAERIAEQEKKSAVENIMFEQEKKVAADKRRQDQESIRMEHMERKRAMALDFIKRDDNTKDLPHDKQLLVLEHRMIDLDLKDNEKRLREVEISQQLKHSNPTLTHLENSALESEIHQLKQHQQILQQKKMQLPAVQNPVVERQQQVRAQLEMKQQNQKEVENTASFQLMEQKYMIHKQLQAVQQYMNENPDSKEAQVKFEQLSFMYKELENQTRMMVNNPAKSLLPGVPPVPAAVLQAKPVAVPIPVEERSDDVRRENYDNVDLKGNMPGKLQQSQQDIQIELIKSQERKQRPEGVTSLDDLMGEESLYDHQQRLERPEPVSQRRPIGTDIRQSEAQIDSNLQTSKKNSINQRVREMSSYRDIRPPKGLGHENMLKSSLTVIEQPKEERMGMTSLSDLGMEIDGNDNEDPFGGMEEIDSEEVVEPPATTAIKKKSSIIDRAKELEKSRM